MPRPGDDQRNGQCAENQPDNQTSAPPDYDHYVTQQLKPIADAILRFLGGRDFDDTIGARRQLSLFS